MRNGEGQAGPNPEGCQTGAGGRSLAQTPGKGREQVCTLEGCQRPRPRKKGNKLLEGRAEGRRSKLFQRIEPAVGENSLAVLPLQRLFGPVFLASSAFWHPSRVRLILSLFRGSALRSDPRLLSGNPPGWRGAHAKYIPGRAGVSSRRHAAR